MFRDIFAETTEKERGRFELLDRTYIGARYRNDFIVFWGDVEYLAPRVSQLLAVAEAICHKRIANIATE